MHKIKLLLILLLAIIGAVMIYLGIVSNMLPPTLTGIGFLIICAIHLLKK